MHELTPKNHAIARQLFKALENHKLVSTVFAGLISAQLFVDDSTNPSAGLIEYNRRYLLGGAFDHYQFTTELKQYFTGTAIPVHKAAGHDGIVLYFSPSEWERRIDEIVAGFETIHMPRQYYEIQNPRPTPALALPEGYSISPISTTLLDSDLKGLEAIRDEMCSERTSVDDFLAQSFGLCLIYENEVAGWCLSEYNTGKACEIGIATLEPHQRRGLATMLTHAFLTEAAERGYTNIGWDCWARNQPSVATALKCGLTLIENYPAVVVLF